MLISNQTHYNIRIKEENTQKIWRIFGTYDEISNFHEDIKKCLMKKDDTLPKFPSSKWFVGNNNWNLAQERKR